MEKVRNKIRITSPLFVWLEVLISSSIMFQYGCKSNPIEPIPIIQGEALYLSLDGGNNNAGLWVLDAQSLNLFDSLGTGQGVPFTIEFSPDYSEWYSSWKEYPSRQSYLYSVDNKTMSILKKVLVGPAPLSLTQDKDKTILIGYLSTPLKFYDRLTLSLLREDTSNALTVQVKSSYLQSKLYMTQIKNGVFTGLTVFDLNSYAIEKTIPVADENRQENMEPADLTISPDEHYAFVSVFNWQGLGGYNSLFIIDLIQSKVIDEYTTGAFAQLCVSPDGRYVYISDPAGYLYMMPSSNEMLRYDIPNHSMEVFARLSELGLSGSSLITDKMDIASDDRTLFVSISGDLKDRNGNWVDLLKIDTATGTILKTFSLPVDSFGHRTQIIKNIKLGISK